MTRAWRARLRGGDATGSSRSGARLPHPVGPAASRGDRRAMADWVEQRARATFDRRRADRGRRGTGRCCSASSTAAGRAGCSSTRTTTSSPRATEAPGQRAAVRGPTCATARLIARGCCDDKADITARLQALDAWLEARSTARRRTRSSGCARAPRRSAARASPSVLAAPPRALCGRRLPLGELRAPRRRPARGRVRLPRARRARALASHAAGRPARRLRARAPLGAADAGARASRRSSTRTATCRSPASPTACRRPTAEELAAATGVEPPTTEFGAGRRCCRPAAARARAPPARSRRSNVSACAPATVGAGGAHRRAGRGRAPTSTCTSCPARTPTRSSRRCGPTSTTTASRPWPSSWCTGVSAGAGPDGHAARPRGPRRRARRHGEPVATRIVPGAGPAHLFVDVLGVPVVSPAGTTRLASNIHGFDEHGRSTTTSTTCASTSGCSSAVAERAA